MVVADFLQSICCGVDTCVTRVVFVEMMVADLVGEYSVLVLNTSAKSSRNDVCVVGEESVAFLLVDAFVLHGIVCFEGDAMANEILVFLCAVSVALIPRSNFGTLNALGT